MIFHDIVLLLWQLTSTIQTRLAIKSKPISRFPLLKLPRVVLLECIENLDLLEIVQFSLISKRAKTITKQIRWNPLDICLVSGKEQQIWLKLSEHPGLTWIIHYKKENVSLNYPYFQSTLCGPTAFRFLVLKDNVIEDIKQMMEHISEVFRSPITDIRIFDESLIEWIINLQPTIRYVVLRDDVISSVNTLERIFKHLKVTQHFGICSVAKDENFHITEPIPCPSISIRNSYWFTLPAILNGTNSVILLNDSMLTPNDINTILKEWQMGSKLRNLEYMQIEAPIPLDANSCNDEIFKNLNGTDGDENDGRPTTIKIHDEYIYTLPVDQTVTNLIRSDGMILSIFGHYKESEGEKMKILLHLQVWGQKT
ncbi:unnamed protein product [Caenorhabditis nigoni]